MAPFKSFVKVAFTIAAPKASINSNNNIDDPSKEYGSLCLQKMCKLFNITPNNNLYLSNNKSGERGVCITNSIKEGDAILSIPISSCFRDDEPPNWYNNNKCENEEVDTVGERYNPSAWSTRLAASVLDMELNQGRDSTTDKLDANEELKLGREIWSSMLPQNDVLRASLPVHWDEDVLSTSKCTALELAVDSAYFARANSVMDLSEELKAALDVEGWSMMNNDDVKELLLDMDALQRKCHDALDIVQTRACRVERKCDDGAMWGPPLRILAPIFDYINHGSFSKGSGNAIYGIESANFDLENAKLVVRATRDLTKGEEVLIDYGDSARPAWKALTSYGFVPEYDENTCVAELFMHGQRFEVDTQSVPFDLVEVAAAQSLLDQSYEDGEIEQVQSGDSDGLPPFVARAIVKRATEAAFNLVTEPDEEESNTEEDFEPGSLLAMNLATNLRWSQHKVLMGFAENLKEFASSTTSVEEE